MKKLLVIAVVSFLTVVVVQKFMFPTTYNTFMTGFITSCVIDVLVVALTPLYKEDEG